MPHREMTTTRLEAFSDGVIAIIITIMVLELRAPAQPTLAAAIKVAPVFISYALSFLVAAIMWVNHHHLIHARTHCYRAPPVVEPLPAVLDVACSFRDRLHGQELPRTDGGCVLRSRSLSVCDGVLSSPDGIDSPSKNDIAMIEHHQHIQRKNALSGALYLLSVPLAYVSIYASFFIFALIPAMYFLPEKKLAGDE